MTYDKHSCRCKWCCWCQAPLHRAAGLAPHVPPAREIHRRWVLTLLVPPDQLALLLMLLLVPGTAAGQGKTTRTPAFESIREQLLMLLLLLPLLD